MNGCTVRSTYCADHGFAHGAEAEELREGIEKILRGPEEDDADGTMRRRLVALLEKVDARDSAAYLARKTDRPTPKRWGEERGGYLLRMDPRDHDSDLAAAGVTRRACSGDDGEHEEWHWWAAADLVLESEEVLEGKAATREEAQAAADAVLAQVGFAAPADGWVTGKCPERGSK